MFGTYFGAVEDGNERDEGCNSEEAGGGGERRLSWEPLSHRERGHDDEVVGGGGADGSAEDLGGIGDTYDMLTFPAASSSSPLGLGRSPPR